MVGRADSDRGGRASVAPDGAWPGRGVGVPLFRRADVLRHSHRIRDGERHRGRRGLPVLDSARRRTGVLGTHPVDGRVAGLAVLSVLRLSLSWRRVHEPGRRTAQPPELSPHAGSGGHQST